MARPTRLIRAFPRPEAGGVDYDNDSSGLDADTIQEAIDEIVDLIGSGGIYFVVTDPLYGAVGDNSTDDTAAIQAAIDAAVANQGGTVYFPSGIYKITAPLEVTGDYAIRLLGDGGASAQGRTGGLGGSYIPAGSTIRQATSNTNGIEFTWPAHPCKIESLRIAGPTGNSSGSGIYLGDTDVNTVDVYVSGFYDGLRQSTSAFYSKHVASRFNDADNRAVYLEAEGNNADFYGCRFENSAIGIDIGGCLGVGIFGGSIELNTTAGIRVNGGSSNGAGLHVAGVYFEHDDGIPDILIGNTAQQFAVSVVGCAFIKSGFTGTGWHIDGQNVVGLTAMGNEFQSTTALRAVGSSSEVVLVNNRNRNSGTITIPTDAHSLIVESYRWEAVTDGEDVFVWDGDDLVHEWKEY